MKIKLKNFQAFRSEEIEINPGLTLINGPTNNGKTAVFRAIQTLLTNPAKAASYINGPALQEDPNSEMVVTLIDSDIPRIEFHRTKERAWYIIDGKKYSKLNRTTLFDIYPDIRKKFLYEPEDPRKLLNFQTEGDGAFPFDRSPMEMFKLFERIFNITDTRSVIDTIRREKEDCKFKLEFNRTEKSKLEQELGVYEIAFRSINSDLIKNYIQQFNASQNTIERLKSRLQKIISYAPYLEAISKLPELSPVSDSDINSVLDLQHKISVCASREKYLNQYESVELSDTSEDLSEVASMLEAKIVKIQSLEKQTAYQRKIESEGHVELERAKTILSDFDLCPLCGQELKGES